MDSGSANSTVTQLGNLARASPISCSSVPFFSLDWACANLPLTTNWVFFICGMRPEI